MWNSADSSASGEHVIILALNSGAGHRVRMEFLANKLERLAIPSVLKLLDAPVESEAYALASGGLPGTALSLVHGDRRGSLLVCDARDLDLSVLSGELPAVAVDNLHPSRERLGQGGHVVYFDTLPHPLLDESFDRIVCNMLLDEDVMERARQSRRGAPTGRWRVTFYAGSEGFLAARDVEAMDDWLSDCPSVFYTRVGGSRHGGVNSIPFLTRNRYLDLLLDTDLLISYPGMSYWEGLLLGAKPVLLMTGSGVHDGLSAYLSRRTGTQILRPGEAVPAEQMILDAMTRPLSFDQDAWRKEVLARSGMDRLVRIVEELWHESRKERHR